MLGVWRGENARCPLWGQQRTQTLPQTVSFGYFGRAGEQRRRKGNAERFCSLQIDQEFKLGGLINRDVAWFGPFENLVHVIGHALEQLREIDGIRHEPTSLDVVAVWTHPRQVVLFGK